MDPLKVEKPISGHTEVVNEQCPILDVVEVVALEKRIEAEGTSLWELMRKAGQSVSAWIIEAIEAPQSVVIFCGSGNNGGDGWVIADDLASRGYEVSLITSCAAEDLRAEPARTAALETSARTNAALTILIHPDTGQLTSLLQSAAVVVDAMLGIGFDGASLKQPYASWVEAINEARSTNDDLIVVAVDVPSGLNAQTGAAAHPCISADVTITMIVCKPGLMQGEGIRNCGELRLARICEW